MVNITINLLFFKSLWKRNLISVNLHFLFFGIVEMKQINRFFIQNLQKESYINVNFISVYFANSQIIHGLLDMYLH